jgi:hypothetical protein
VLVASLAIAIHQNWTQLDSGLDVQELVTTCRSSRNFFCLCLVFLYTKNALKLSRYSTIFFEHLFSSELSNNRGTYLPCICPSGIYSTEQEHKVSLFPCVSLSFLPVFTIVAPWSLLL